MCHVMSSETEMPVSRLIKLAGSDRDIMDQVAWKELPNLEHGLEPLHQVLENSLQVLRSLL